MKRRNRLRNGRHQAQFGADGAIMAAATIAAAGIGANATANAAKQQASAMEASAKTQADALVRQNENANQLQQEQIQFTRDQNELNRNLQKEIQMNLQMLTGQQNTNQLREAAKIQVRNGGRVRNINGKKYYSSLQGNHIPGIVTPDKGTYIPIANTGDGILVMLKGPSHDNGGVDIDINGNKDIEAEGGELMHVKYGLGGLSRNGIHDVQFISKHSLPGTNFNPSKAVLSGIMTPDEAFATQETIKDVKGISDDGKHDNKSPLRRMVAYGGINTLPISPDLSLDFLAPVATGIVAGTRQEEQARYGKEVGGWDPTLKKRYPQDGIELITAYNLWRLKYGDTRPYPRTYKERVNAYLTEKEEERQAKSLQRQHKIESSDIYRKINQIDNDYLNNMFIHPSYEQSMTAPRGDTYNRRRLMRCGGRRKAKWGDWWNTQRGNIWGAGLNAVGNLGGALITTLGNNAASRYLTQGYNNAADILAGAYGNLKTVDMSALNRDDFRAAHAMAALQAPIVNTGAERAAAERSRARLARRINNNTLSSAAAQNRLGRLESDYNDRISQIEANADKIRQGIIQENMNRITQVSQQNAQLDTQANQAYAQAYLNLLQYNNDIENEKITGAAQARADAITQNASNIAGTRQANAASWAGALTTGLGGIGNALATNAKMKHELEMGMYGWDDNNLYNYYMRNPNAEGFEEFMEKYKDNYPIDRQNWYRQLYRRKYGEYPA